VNLGTGRGSSVLEVLAATERVSGTPVPHEVVTRRPGDPAVVFADAGLAERVLDWKATRGLDAIIASAYAWHSRNS
jgi:UDP-glucose 4-epimerase